jgi:hypothetical protein
MLWSGLIRINKIVKLDDFYHLYVDVTKSCDSFKSFLEQNNIQDVINVKLNPLMLCNYYDQFKIKTTKKFIDIDFSNSNVYIKLDINNNTISVKTMTKTETKINKIDEEVNGEKNGRINGEKNDRINGEKNDRINGGKNKRINMSMRKRFTSDLIGICKKIDF